MRQPFYEYYVAAGYMFESGSGFYIFLSRMSPHKVMSESRDIVAIEALSSSFYVTTTGMKKYAANIRCIKRK